LPSNSTQIAEQTERWEKENETEAETENQLVTKSWNTPLGKQCLTGQMGLRMR